MTREPLKWQALEYVYYEKTDDWYWIVGIAGITAAALALIFGNIILSILFVVAAITIMIHGARVPGVMTIELQERGIRAGQSFYPFAGLNSFSINEKHDPPVLALDSKAFLIPDIKLLLEDVDVEEVRDHLLDHLNEKYHEPSFTDGLIHYLGF